MTTTKEELVAAGIRKQINFLEVLLDELKGEAKDTGGVLPRIRDAEKQIHKLLSQIRD